MRSVKLKFVLPKAICPPKASDSFDAILTGLGITSLLILDSSGSRGLVKPYSRSHHTVQRPPRRRFRHVSLSSRCIRISAARCNHDRRTPVHRPYTMCHRESRSGTLYRLVLTGISLQLCECHGMRAQRAAEKSIDAERGCSVTCLMLTIPL